MNAPFPAVSVTATMVEIAHALGVTKQAAQKRANSESWANEVVGTRRLYPLATLPTDVRQAVDPSWHYVIVSLKRPEPVLRSYRLVDGGIYEERVVVVGDG